MSRRYAPATQRNRDPILAVLSRVLPEGTILEIASGSGEHAVYFAPRLPGRRWLPSDRDPDAVASIAAWRDETPEAQGALLPPIVLDVQQGPWPEEPLSGVVAINMVHISPWEATLALLAGARAHLRPGGVLYLYGPYRVGGQMSESNHTFEGWLKSLDPAYGVRELEAVLAAAEALGFEHLETVPMPANNLSLVFRLA